MLKRIYPDYMTARDIVWLKLGLDHVSLPYDDKVIIQALVDDEAQLWRFDDGIVLTRIIYDFNLKMLVIWLVSGKGYIKNLDTMCAEMDAFARDNECKYVFGLTENETLKKLYKRKYPKAVIMTNTIREI